MEVDGETVYIGGCKTCEGEGKVCPNCCGAGYLLKRVAVGHPDFGKLYPCQLCMVQVGDKWQRNMERKKRAVKSWEVLNG